MERYKNDCTKEIAAGLRVAEGDRLVDVIRIWRYRVEQFKKNGENDRLLRCAQILIPELKQIILDENTDLGLRGETILTLCSIVAALTNTQEEELAKSLIKETLEGLAMSLKLPIIIYGRTAAEQILNQFKDKESIND